MICKFIQLHSLSVLQKYGVQDGAVLEEKTMDLGPEEISNLFQRSLISNAPLTEVYCNNMGKREGATGWIDIIDSIQIKTESGEPESDDTKEERIRVKLLVSNSNKVLCAEADEGFADIVLGFLALPLGAVVKLLNTNSKLRCVNNLCKSVQGLSVDYIKSNECRDMLLSPKLAPYFGCGRGLLRLDELPPQRGSANGHCYSCFWAGGKNAKCTYGVNKATSTHLNPKSPSGKTEKGGGYAKGPGKFMVTDDIRLSPLTPTSITKFICSLSTPLSKLVEKEANIEQTQVLSLLRAALISETPLSDVFFLDEKRKGCILLLHMRLL